MPAINIASVCSTSAWRWSQCTMQRKELQASEAYSKSKQKLQSLRHILSRRRSCLQNIHNTPRTKTNNTNWERTWSLQHTRKTNPYKGSHWIYTIINVRIFYIYICTSCTWQSNQCYHHIFQDVRPKVYQRLAKILQLDMTFFTDFFDIQFSFKCAYGSRASYLCMVQALQLPNCVARGHFVSFILIPICDLVGNLPAQCTCTNEEVKIQSLYCHAIQTTVQELSSW